RDRRRLPRRGARPERRRHRHRPRPRGAARHRQGSQLPQSRRRAGVRRLQHHHRVPDQVHLRPARRRGARRRPPPRRARARRHPRPHLGIRRGARQVRGTAAVKRFVFAVPGDLATPTGGYAYDRRMAAELLGLGWEVEIADIGSEFPRPSESARGAARARLLAVPRGTPIVVDGLAFGVLPELAAELHRDHPLLALVHHPLALETGIPPAEAEEFHRRERAALAHTDRVIVTSPSTARRLSADYAVAAERITVALPGSEPRAKARNGRAGPLALIAVGAVVRRKGYDVLIDALARLRDLPWRMTIAGDRPRSPATVATLEEAVRRHALGDRIAFAGAVDDARLAALHAEADLFVLPSRFEGYGMAFAEAIAH